MHVTNPRGGGGDGGDRQHEERMEGSGTTESGMIQFKYGAGVPVVWSVWCNDHRAELQFRLNLKLLKKTKAGEGPVRWSLQSDDLERPLTQRTGLLADLRAWLWHQSRTRAWNWIPHEGWQERRANVYSLDRLWLSMTSTKCAKTSELDVDAMSTTGDESTTEKLQTIWRCRNGANNDFIEFNTYNGTEENIMSRVHNIRWDERTSRYDKMTRKKHYGKNKNNSEIDIINIDINCT